MKYIIRVLVCFLCFAVSSLNSLAQSGTMTIVTVAGAETNGTARRNGVPATSGAAYCCYSDAIAVDAAGNLYHSDFWVDKVTSGGLIYYDVATPESGAGGLAVDPAGNLLFDDIGWAIVLKLTSGGLYCCVAGTGTGASGYNGDSRPASSALLNEPHGLAVDAAGNLYIADTANHRVRKVTPGGAISTVAGNGASGFSGDGGPAIAAQLESPLVVAVDGAGNLYIAESGNRVRRVTVDGLIDTIAGTGNPGFSGDGGPARFAQLDYPAGIAADAEGNLYIADLNNNRIRRVSPDGVISTFAGNGTAGFSGDGGPATSAQLNAPFALAVDAAGSLYIGDNGNGRIRKVFKSPAKPEKPAGRKRDFNGDGRGDILLRDAAGNVSLWLMNGYTISENSFVANVWPGWTIAGSGDFNGDGKADILWRDGNGNVATWLMDGSALTSFDGSASMPKEWAVAAVADFDGDGKADILWRDTGGAVLLWLMNGHRIANYGFIANIWTGWKIVGTGDFNGDGKADILWRDINGNVATWLMDGATVSSYYSTGGVATSWIVAGAGDFDGDGKADILWREAAGNVAIWLMNGHAIANNSIIANIPAGWTITGTADFNGDSREDILWRDGAGNIAIWLMNGTAVSSYSSIGTAADRTVQ